MSDDKSLNQPEPSGEPSDYYVSAPVEIPTPEQMTVKLVPFHQVTKWDEARSDGQIWFSVLFALIGAILGILGEWFTSPQLEITRPSIVLTVVLIALGVPIFLMACCRYKRRADRIKKDMEETGVILSEIVERIRANQQRQTS